MPGSVLNEYTRMPASTALSTTGCKASESPNSATASYWAVMTFCMAASNFCGSKSGTEIQSTVALRSLRIFLAKSAPSFTARPNGLFCTMISAMRICFFAFTSAGRTIMVLPLGGLMLAAGVKSRTAGNGRDGEQDGNCDGEHSAHGESPLLVGATPRDSTRSSCAFPG